MNIDSLYKGPQGKGIDMLDSMQKQGRALVQPNIVRWQRNRLMYEGKQWVTIRGNSVRSFVPPESAVGSRRPEIINRLRQFVDGRVSILTSKRPPFTVIPDNSTISSVESSRTAEKFVEAKWVSSEWDLDNVWRSLARAGDIDGMAWLCVNWDPNAGKYVRFPFRADGTPVDSIEEREALEQEDPEGQVLWRSQEVYEGDVRFRVVRGGAISFDPMGKDDWREARWVCESRVVPNDIIELEAGKKITELRKEQFQGDLNQRSDTTYGDTGSVAYEDGEGQEAFVPKAQAMLVHEFFIKPQPDWPKGAHVKWCQDLPGAPYLVEEWEGDLPYFPYVPRPHGAAFIRSKGIVDDLAPLQFKLNRVSYLLGEWLDRIAKPPLLLYGGSLRPETPRVYNEKGYVSVTPGMGDPRWLSVPNEPAATMTNYLSFILTQMAEIALLNDAARGTPPGQGVEAAVGINMLIQQNEQQYAGTASELVRVMEWGVSRALDLVQKYYIIPRLVTSPGISDAYGFSAFRGKMIRGSTCYKITGSLLPRSRAAQAQMLMQFATMTGNKMDLSKYLTQFVETDIDEIISRERQQYNRQMYENKLMTALAQHPDADNIVAQYEEMQATFAEAVNQIKDTQPDPVAFLYSQGVREPSLADLGVPMPKTEEFDADDIHINTMDMICTDDGFFKFHPLVKYAIAEHRRDHLRRINARLSQQQSILNQGPMNAEPGKPQQPKPQQQQGTNEAGAGA